MDEWKYAQNHPSEGLARLHYFSVKKKHETGEVELRITVKEFATPEVGSLQFFAMTDQPFDPKTNYRPCGWANSLLGALSECLLNCRKTKFVLSETQA
jgi:hypothetical protein